MKPIFSPSRRELLALGAAGLALPGRARAATARQRRFLFVHAAGGWDPVFVFAPMFHAPDVYTPLDSTTAQLGDFTFVDSPNRPLTRAFFERWASRCCVINGLEVRSITHERCRQVVLTGGAGGGDDWPSILASRAPEALMPYVVGSGPAFSARFSDLVVRLGSGSQFERLRSGQALADSDTPILAPSSAADAAVARYLSQRGESFTRNNSGAMARYGSANADSLQRMAQMQALAPELGAGAPDDLHLESLPLIDCLEQGLSRCAMVAHEGLYDRGWDNHADIELQTYHYEDLFEGLDLLLADLEGRSGTAGGSLLDETTVVVFSEMGRTPILSALGGKDHWTFTSALIIGSGVAGGRVVGGYTDALRGAPTSLDDGAVTDSGVAMTASHLGATLLALGDVDPGEFLGDIEPIQAAIA